MSQNNSFFHEILSFRTYSFYEKCNIACFGHLIHRKIVSTDEPCTVFYDGSESGVKMARNRVPGPENSPNIICFDSGFVANLASPPSLPPLELAEKKNKKNRSPCYQ